MGFSNVFIWWFNILLIGFIFLPITVKIFSKFYDRGYLFSKTIGIAGSAYLLWLFSSLKLIPFYRISAFAILFVILGIILWITKGFKTWKSLWNSQLLKTLIAEEILFLAAIIGWSFIRGLRPEIYGLEKFMDFGFINSILRTRYMPPTDIWFAGNSINYYYFGHFICAFLTKLSGIDSAIAYNLMIATLFGFCLALGFSITSNLIYIGFHQNRWKAFIGGILSALLLTLGSNLHTFIYGLGLPWLKNHGFIHGEIKNYYYPDSTRFIGYNPPTHDKTIHEFPAYSFVVADLHAHVSDIPYVLTILAVLMAIILNLTDKAENVTDGEAEKPLLSLPKTYSKENISVIAASCKNFFQNYLSAELILIGFLLAVFQMSNFWDFPIYLLVSLVTLLYSNMIRFQFKAPIGRHTFLQIIFILLFSKALTSPFKIMNTTQGIHFTLVHTPLYQFLVLWGYQLLLVLAFLLVLFFEYRLSIKNNLEPGGKISLNWRRLLNDLSPIDAFCLIVIMAAAGLIFLPEWVYVKDIYSGDFKRANTMFKLTFQAFIMFALVIGYIYFRISFKQKSSFHRSLLKLPLLLLLCLPLIYPYYSVKLGYYGVPELKRYVGLDGTLFLKQLDFDDYQAIQWLKHHVKGQPAILEANGDSYSDYERISMATGLPTVLGWYVHEWLWRGNPDVVNHRAMEVTTVYESDDLKATRDILRRYKIQYIIIGGLERRKFINLNTNKLTSLGKTVFQSPTTTIIKVIY
jgi:uncharacterized membrane protein